MNDMNTLKLIPLRLIRVHLWLILFYSPPVQQQLAPPQLLHPRQPAAQRQVFGEVLHPEDLLLQPRPIPRLIRLDLEPIPGTKRVKYLEENMGAVNVRLTPEELAQIDAILPAGAASGERYNAQAMKGIDR